MNEHDRERLRGISSFPALVKYLRDELDWPIETESFEDLTFDYEPSELGLDPDTAAKVRKIKQLRPLSAGQPWGIFFIDFEPKRLPVVALRRILSHLVVKKRQTATAAHRASWQLHDLLFISSYGEDAHRDLAFAHFAEDQEGMGDLPVLKVLDWDDEDTVAHLEYSERTLKEKLRWPDDENDLEGWRKGWSAAFTLKPREVITTAKKLSVEMAELARRIRRRVNSVLAIETDRGPMRKLMAAFKEALIHDLSADDFADMYAQTVTYGLLAARVSRPAGLVADNLADMVPVTNPFLRDLLSTFLKVGGRKAQGSGGVDFDELGINEVVQALRDAAMDAVLRDFDDKNPREDPVIHFYELFLKEYDPEKRMQRGVFYTPRPVVSYIVRSVDELLRTEFGLVDGLADTTTWGEMVRRHDSLKIPEGAKSEDPFVCVLDPACGTGTFLVEVIDIVHQTMLAKWRGQHLGEEAIRRRWNEYVADHLLPRLYGFELLMAPYAIAHMKIGLKLAQTGYTFAQHERVRVYLTNSLEPAQDFSGRLEFDVPALAHEAQAVNAVKRNQRFTVVIGNPPYAKLSQNQGEWIDAMMERYKTTIKTEEIQRQALSNDYVKFICLASTILERAGAYVLGMITDNSYLDGPLFRDMRATLMECFRVIRLTDLGGNSRRVDAVAGDQNVFDIQQGVAILLGCKLGTTERHVYFAAEGGSRDEKASWLTSNTSQSASYVELFPAAPQRYFLPIPAGTSPAWESWPSLPEVFAGGIRSGRPLPFNGAALATRHDSLAIAFTRAELRDNLRIFFDRTESRQSLDERFNLCSSSHFDFDRARSEATLTDAESCIRPILYRPFDLRHVVYHPLIIGEPRVDVMRHLLAGSLALLSTRRVTGKPYDNVFVCRGLVEYKAATHDRNTQVFPLYLIGAEDGRALFPTGRGESRHPNIAPSVYRDWKNHLDVDSPEEVFYTIYALLFSAEYRRRFRNELQRDYARVPRPSFPALNRELVELGSALVALHLMESPKLDRFLTRVAGDGTTELAKGYPRFVDGKVYINPSRWFEGVPEAVWNFHIGGYQVCERWLKDRRGRVLSGDDIAHYQKIVVALNETIRLMQEIDRVIDAHGGWPAAFAPRATEDPSGVAP